MDLIDYVKLGNLTKVQELIAQNVDLNIQDEYGYTALIWAACYNKPEIVKLLVEAGADREITDIDRHNALFWANYYNNLEVADILNKSLDDKAKITNTLDMSVILIDKEKSTKKKKGK